MDDELNLMPCPFCGGQPDLSFRVYDTASFRTWGVSCCVEMEGDTDREATIAAWNRRAAPSAEASVQDDWAPYLKEGETPLDRLKREIKDNEAVTSLLAKERTKNATAPPAADAGGVKDERDAMADLRKAERSLSFLCDLLPAEFMWGDSLQADALDEILDRYDSALSRKVEAYMVVTPNGERAALHFQRHHVDEKVRGWGGGEVVPLVRAPAAATPEQPAEAQGAGLTEAVADIIELYAESYERMARIGEDGRTHCINVAVDLRRNIIPQVKQAIAAHLRAAGKGGDGEIVELARKLVEYFPNRLDGMYCDGVPVGRQLVASVAKAKAEEQQG